MTDLTAEIDQSACDKLLASTNYPLVVFEKNESFPGCANMAAAMDGGFYRYSDAEVDKLFAECVAFVRANDGRADMTIHDQLYAFGGAIVQQAKLIQSAQSNADYEGPSKAELDAIIDGGIEQLGKSLRHVMGDWGLYAWCPHLRVTVKQRPALKLSSPTIDLKGVRIEIRATGELYAKHPWWNCYKYCFKWEKVIKCERIASITVSPDIAIEAHADLSAAGAQVFAKAKFDKLRLDYPILREIPLEGLANNQLDGRPVKIYDAAALVASVPVLGSKFGISAIVVPPKPHSIEVGVTLYQI